ncbi:RNA polymerase sigma factor [Armatimonas rosea]|uniref:RNA polymerase sigma factor n=1 Tax=Armatimonas rosea TaxID=685828 RepID=A0A7W9SVI4_ARMRO|nr:RNA polymerase sigma factor [Armatimonas rosea]MBB6053617.1 RNA polymerase sigma-70 factor (ECF subfamily) [Armatimonas rosea]
MRKPGPPPPDPLACLFERFGGEILGLLIRLTHGDRSEAEDLTQETFVAAFQGQAKFSGRVPVRAWLAGIAVRRWRDRQRRPRPKSVPLALDPPSEERTDQSVTQRVVLEQALAQLSDSQQAAILLVLVRGLTYREAADALGEPEGTIKWRVSEASKRLRTILTEFDIEEKP